jgi:hypothetical protein
MAKKIIKVVIEDDNSCNRYDPVAYEKLIKECRESLAALRALPPSTRPAGWAPGMPKPTDKEKR